ncbi:MAG: hypothetical protein AB7P78_03000 [Candidatus Binatia bacterium]
MLTTLALLLHVVTAAAGTAPECGSAPRAVAGKPIELAPPPGYVDACAQDAELCRKLTGAYSPSVITLAYFVTDGEWAAHKRNPTAPFTRYLVAQSARSKTAEQLPQVKSFIRSQQYGAPERARLAATLAANGEAALGVFDESPDSISMGAVEKRAGSGSAQEDGMLLVMTNSAIAVGPDLLSLYVYSDVRDVPQVAHIEALTKRWLQCVRQSNAKRAPWHGDGEP